MLLPQPELAKLSMLVPQPELPACLPACSWQALASMNESLSGCFSMASLQIQRSDEVIERQQVSLKELRRKLEVSEECCALKVQALDRAVVRNAALKARNGHLQTEAAKVGCCVTLHQ